MTFHWTLIDGLYLYSHNSSGPLSLRKWMFMCIVLPSVFCHQCSDLMARCDGLLEQQISLGLGGTNKALPTWLMNEQRTYGRDRICRALNDSGHCLKQLDISCSHAVLTQQVQVAGSQFTADLLLRMADLCSSFSKQLMPLEIKPKYFLTACAMIKNEMKVLLEWIEFHRIQGVEHFIFFDDESSDDVYLLPRLYESLGYPDLVEIIPQNFRRRSRPGDHSYTDHDQGQWQALNHCNSRMRGVSEWLLVSDVDEFMFSPRHYTIAAFLRSQADDVSQYSVKVIRFGSNKVQRENRVRLSLNAYNSRVTVVHEIFNEDILLTSRNPKRAPFPDVDPDFPQRFDEICAPTGKGQGCGHAVGKSIWRADHCGLASVHSCGVDPLEGTAYPALDILRINHYAFRSKEHMDNQPKHQMGAIKGSAYAAFDSVWFSLVDDNSTKPYRQELLKRLNAIPTTAVYHREMLPFGRNADVEKRFLLNVVLIRNSIRCVYIATVYIVCSVAFLWFLSKLKKKCLYYSRKFSIFCCG